MSGPLENKVVEIISQLQQSAPKATGMVLLATRVDAVSYLIQGVLGVILLCFLAWIARKVLRHCKSNPDWEDDMPVYLLGGFVYLGVVAFGVATSSQLLDPWNWVALAKPELWIAHLAVLKLVH